MMMEKSLNVKIVQKSLYFVIQIHFTDLALNLARLMHFSPC